MNRLSKTILISAIAILGIGCLPSFASANGLLNIVFEQKPLFQETNFLPGESAEYWIEVENKSLETQAIAVEVINYSSCSSNCFSDRLNLKVSKNSTGLYEDSLTNFFNAGQIKLSDLAVGEKTKYFFKVTFLPDSGNQYQAKEVSFDFRIGSLGKESIGPEIPPGGGGGGGFFVLGLEIFNESVSGVGETEATITWNTNIPATSRVIYSLEDQPRILQLDNPPNYGYFYSTAENSALTVNHQMVITGLVPATTYYFRCVSRGSLAVSKELKFTTAGVKGEEIVSLLPEAPPLGKEDGIEPEVKGEFVEEEIITEEEEDEDLDKFLATAGAFMAAQNLCWLFFIVIIILTALYLLSRDKKEKEIKKKDLIFLSILILLIVLYCIFCCSFCWILIFAVSLLFILSAILRIHLAKSQSV